MQIKVTAPPALVRNRKSRPDDWEKSIIEGKFLSPDWTRGQVFYQAQPNQGRDAFRVMVPEYYAKSCLSCHGGKKGEVDITGYPKEGASEGDLGGIISITLFRRTDDDVVENGGSGMSRLSIPARLVLLSAVLLIILAGTTIFLTGTSSGCGRARCRGPLCRDPADGKRRREVLRRSEILAHRPGGQPAQPLRGKSARRQAPARRPAHDP